ncbi:heparinase II/III family protein [Pseudomonas putida]
MMTREILAPITPEAYVYINENTQTDSKADYQKLRKLFDSNKLEAKSFDDTDLCISSFDWISVDKDRNWWWQLQALPFLNWFVNSMDLQCEEETSRYFSLCLDTINNWILKAQSNAHSPLVWHDHASAYRARNLTNWLIFCISKNLLTHEDSRAASLARLISEHLKWLMQDSNYSKFTNHGFDQAMIGLTIALMFESEELEPCRQINRQRLISEISFAFTDQGVHKENSPGYQKMMLTRLKQLRTLTSLGDIEISTLGEKHIEKAELFLKAITLPNGNLPMLGDTRDGDIGLQYTQSNEVDIIDYSASGYVIARGRVLNKDFHLIFKSSHLSNYHRHDDDLSLHLYFDGKVILGDGGLGSHNEKDHKRIALRSKFAHTVPHLEGVTPIRDNTKLLGHKPTIHLDGKKLIGTTSGYGNTIKRQIDLDLLALGKLVITDEVEGESQHRLACNIYSPLGPINSANKLLLSINENSAAAITTKNGEKTTKYTSFHSSKFGHFSHITAFTFLAPSNGDSYSNKVAFEIDLNYHSNHILHQLEVPDLNTITIKEYGTWYFDDQLPTEACHNLLTLGWLEKINSPESLLQIIKSFSSYHDAPAQPKSKYYIEDNSLQTLDERLATLNNLKNKADCADEFHDLVNYEICKIQDSINTIADHS